MTESDDGLLGGGGGGVDIPQPSKEAASRTAEPAEQISEQARKNRKRRLSASFLTLGEPKISEPGLLGILRTL